MSGDMERVMREIHVMFAKAERVSENGDTIIVDKKKVFALLEALNHEVYDAMDRFEETRASREESLKKLETESDAVIDKTRQSAEEIYAASILYSDSTLKELEDEVAHARELIHQTWEDMDKRMADRLRMLEQNRRELKHQLEQMEQSRIYVDLIGKAKRQELEEEEEQKSLNKTVRITEHQKKLADKKQAGEMQEEESGLTEEQKKIEIYVAEAYRDKIASTDDLPDLDFDDDFDSVADNITEFRAEDFDLDAEYFAWKEEINGSPVYVQGSKKGIKDIFKRVK